MTTGRINQGTAVSRRRSPNDTHSVRRRLAKDVALNESSPQAGNPPRERRFGNSPVRQPATRSYRPPPKSELRTFKNNYLTGYRRSRLPASPRVTSASASQSVRQIYNFYYASPYSSMSPVEFPDRVNARYRNEHSAGPGTGRTLASAPLQRGG